MKLFIWADPYHIPYGSAMLIVMAPNEEKARKLAAKGKAYSYGKYCEEDQDWSELVKTLGPPTRVLDKAGAEWHKWEE